MINNADRVRGCVFGVGALLMLASGTAGAQYATTVQTVTGPVADWPTATVAAGAPNKIVGGGARTNWVNIGNLLTQSSPGLPGQNAWVGAGKDHSVAEPTTLSVFGIALNDPNDDWDVGVFTATSAMAPHPVATAPLPAGYALTGGGCTVNWQQSAPAPAGNLLTASFPSSLTSWECRSKDHSVSDPSTITAYVIGIRPKKAGLPLPTVQITHATSAVGPHPSVAVAAVPGAVVTGGGALAAPSDPNGAGQLLTGSFPTTAAGSAVPNGWLATSKDHSVASPGTVTAYAVNLTFPATPAAPAKIASAAPVGAPLLNAAVGTLAPRPMVVAPQVGQYVLTIERFIANRQTLDDALNFDGWGDEIFIQSVVQQVQILNGSVNVAAPDVRQSFTFGDVNGNFLARIQAGSGRKPGFLDAGSKGGIVTGDVIDRTGPCTPVLPDRLCLPMEIWRGQLVQGQTTLAITPTIWEFDPPSAPFSIVSDSLNWITTAAKDYAAVRDIFTAVAPMVSAGLSPAMVLGDVAAKAGLNILDNVLGVPAPRPIGISKQGNGYTLFQPRTIPFTYDFAQLVLDPNRQLMGLGSGEFTVNYRDDDNYQGDYTLVLKVRRLY